MADNDNHESTGEPTEIASLTDDERRVLAVLVAVGGASLTADQIASLGEIDEVEPVLVELERRGLLMRDDRGRHVAAAGVMGRLRRALDVVDTVDRVLRQLISIAEDGRLTLDDLDAVLGIAGWAAEAGRLTELQQLVEAVETTLSFSQRVDAWLQLLARAKEAARQLGDAQAEAWADEQLRAFERALARAGPAGRAGEVVQRAVAGRRIEQPSRPSVVRMGLATVVVAAAAVAGFAVATAVGAEEGEAGPTVTLPGQTVTGPGETVTLPGSTVTVGGETVTLPGSTVTLPGETVTLPNETVTLPGTDVTTTVFVTPGPG
jgi:hypothetical protein